uniref:Uncharacterized protein n=1 Tax=Fagus sylvatica TaxID=28930 RepID=A0A2N9J075_FAGSY
MALVGVVAWGERICEVGWGDLCDGGNLAATLDRARQRGLTATITGKPTHRETWKLKTHRERCSHLIGDPRREDPTHDGREETQEGRQ